MEWMVAVDDVFQLIGLVAFTLGGAIAKLWIFGGGNLVSVPREYKEKLRTMAGVPTAVAAAGLLAGAASSPVAAMTVFHSAGCLLLVVGLYIPAATRVPAPENQVVVPVESGRHAAPRSPMAISTRTVLLACGYGAGCVGWFMGLAYG